MMRGYGSYGYGIGDSMMGGSWFGPIMMIVFWGLVIAAIVALVVWAVRSSSGHGGTAAPSAPPAALPGHDDAVAIAKRRLASGEIEKDKYDEIMAALNS